MTSLLLPGYTLNTYKFVVKATRLTHLVELGTLPAHAPSFLEAAVVAGLNIVVAGGTQAGKPSLSKNTHKAHSARPCH